MPSYEMVNDSTLQSVVQTACALLSLPVPADPAGDQDPAVVLMRTVLNLGALEMMNSYEWSELTKLGSIMVYTDAPPDPSYAVEKAFDLPADFYRFIDQTQWNGAMRFPAIGPVSPQGWMTYLTFPISSNFTLTWQVRQRQIWFLNPPPAPGQEFKFMYLSRGIVQDADNPDLYKNVATKNGDKYLLDGVLLPLMVKVKWLESKGFDSSAAMRDFLTAYDIRIGAQKGANILNMAGNCGGYPLVSAMNAPDGSIYGMRTVGA